MGGVDSFHRFAVSRVWNAARFPRVRILPQRGRLYDALFEGARPYPVYWGNVTINTLP